ncbi:hypothetical protein SAMN05421839_10717 [Halolactibacillus halophilus]|uniref:DUF3221 domain-containing protein n=1 Tax=Halolactibacillus halophilus TaxID=306540 RepID=A0A1I5MZB5_9BACI|nr:DUF3221 domain-containing protein [Halolactibacillus halophilus]GEM01119.1 hypothetical protein HHA03_06510 [Halolactibacillus halophilus]SFP14878.1 hypothetical protein SAMN05421839_10717 [Halolactibacillus halophilus]
MKQSFFYILILSLGILTLWLFISHRQTTPDLTGYVIRTTPKRLLIQSENPKDMRAYGGRERYYELIWVNIDEKRYDVGDYVDVWYHSISQHYPRIATTKKITQSMRVPQKDTTLTRKQIIQKVYQDTPSHPAELFVIDQIEYDEQAAVWHVDLYDVFSERYQSFSLDDSM